MIAAYTGTAGRDSNPLAGFNVCGSIREKVYLLAVKTGSSTMDDALYTLAHPTAPDATPGGATHEDVVAAIRDIAESWPEFSPLATELASAYEEEYCN